MRNFNYLEIAECARRMQVQEVQRQLGLAVEALMLLVRNPFTRNVQTSTVTS